MLKKDAEEEFLQKRDELEYLASFINPEAVSKTKESRKNLVSVTDEDFLKILSTVAGGGELPKFISKER